MRKFDKNRKRKIWPSYKARLAALPRPPLGCESMIDTKRFDDADEDIDQLIISGKLSCSALSEEGSKGFSTNDQPMFNNRSHDQPLDPIARRYFGVQLVEDEWRLTVSNETEESAEIAKKSKSEKSSRGDSPTLVSLIGQVYVVRWENEGQAFKVENDPRNPLFNSAIFRQTGGRLMMNMCDGSMLLMTMKILVCVSEKRRTNDEKKESQYTEYKRYPFD
ncbi:hypothetical protein DFH28DRAFT_934839 [Melampsora americana]|nr:hypothetical protein DFH28DRAFT_934839 [Melampsora americana]